MSLSARRNNSADIAPTPPLPFITSLEREKERRQVVRNVNLEELYAKYEECLKDIAKVEQFMSKLGGLLVESKALNALRKKIKERCSKVAWKDYEAQRKETEIPT